MSAANVVRKGAVLLFVPFLVCSLLCAVYSAGWVNLWSLQHLRAQVDHRLPSAVSLPAAHPRAAHWGALHALAAGQADVALASLQPLAAGGDRFALQIAAQANQSLGNWDPAIQVWRETANELRLFQVAEAALAAGDVEAAQAAYEVAWQLDAAGRSTATLARFLWRERDDLPAAEEVMRASLDAHPRFAYRSEWLRLLAEILLAQQKGAEALQVYQQTIAQDPEHWQAYYEAAWLYQLGDRPEAAMAAIEAAMVRLPDDVGVARRAGQIYEAGVEAKKALAAHQKLLALRPGDQVVQEAIERLAGAQKGS